MTGRIIKVVFERSFGFIIGEDGKEYFFHRDDVQGFYDDIAEDMTRGNRIMVTFTPTRTPKGMRASEVTVTSLP